VSLEVVQSFGVVSLLGAAGKPLRQFGVPPGGAFDTESLALANTLVGNDAALPAWELGMAQASFRLLSDGLVGVAGALARVVGPHGEFEGGVFSAPAGSEFSVLAPSVGARVYVAFRASASAGQVRFALDDPPESVLHRSRLRVVPGPQADSFGAALLGREFAVSQTGNRVGIRLEPVIGAHTIELTSEPQCVGTVQISNDGTPIVIGPDGPTIGGYPKAAVVATCDIPCLAQLRPGDAVIFEPVTVHEARRLNQEVATRLAKRLSILKVALESGFQR
jgi:allophanate hydrolase subunit 2